METTMKKKPGSYITSDFLLKRFNNRTLKKAEKELESIHGKRYKKYREEFFMAGELKYEPGFPLYIMLEQTFRCNLSCISCIHNHKQLKERYKTGVSCMPWKLFKRIILEAEEHLCPSIAMHTNDEPLLVRDLNRRINFAGEHGFMDIIVTTNGTLFTESRIREIVDAGVTKILFSIDAATEETYKKVRKNGDFAKVVWAIKETIAYRKKIGKSLPIIRASFVPNLINQHELRLFLKKFSGIADYVEIQPFSVYYDANRDLIPKGSKRISGFHCEQPWRSLIIRANGKVLPCCSFYGNGIVVGDLYKNSLYEIFNSPRMKNMRKEFKKGNYRNLNCKRCSTAMYTVN